MKKLFLLGFTASLLAISCTVQKRLHTSGYHVTWKSKYKSTDKIDLTTKEVSNEEKKITSEDVALVENAKEIENEPFVIINSENSNDSFSYTSTSEKKQKSKINNSYKSLNSSEEKNTLSKYMAIKKIAKKATKSSSSDDNILLVLLLVLCFFIPPVAVAIASDFDITKIIISLILTLLFWVPGIIYALYIVLKDRL